MNKRIASIGWIALAALLGSGAMAETSGSFEGEAKDAWLTGRLETMYLLNEQLNPISISTQVEGGVVHLTGAVESEIDRDLAGALARNLDGIVEVENELLVDANAVQEAEPTSDPADGRRNFGSWVDDATTTAAVKARLVGNANTKGLQIDVDTWDDVVTLSGRVSTPGEKALAEEVARRVSDVESVRNNLVVDPA